MRAAVSAAKLSAGFPPLPLPLRALPPLLGLACRWRLRLAPMVMPLKKGDSVIPPSESDAEESPSSDDAEPDPSDPPSPPPAREPSYTRPAHSRSAPAAARGP